MRKALLFPTCLWFPTCLGDRDTAGHTGFGKKPQKSQLVSPPQAGQESVPGHKPFPEGLNGLLLLGEQTVKRARRFS